MIMLWLLSQTLGFALPARPCVAGQDLPRRVAWEQNQGGHHGYDTGYQSCVIYDAELPSVTTEDSIDLASAMPNSVGYDSYLVSTIRIAGAPRAPPVEDFGFLAVKGGRLGNQTTRQHVADVAAEMESRGWNITHGGGRFPEEYLPGPGGGRLGSSFPDITATKNGRALRVNTIDTRANGVTPTTREAENAARIRSQTPGDHLLLVPKP